MDSCKCGNVIDNPQMSLKNKTLFITGASRGIGKAIALRAAQDGANIVIAAKTAEPHPKLPGTIYTAAEEMEAAGGKALPVIVDVRSEEMVQAAVDAAVEKSGATCLKDMGKVMGQLKDQYAGQIDMGKAGARVKARLCS